MNQPIEEKWKERLDDILYTVTGDCVSAGRNELKSFIENLLEQEKSEKPCCVAELGCLCPGKDGMSEHDSEDCLCPEHYAKHEEWLRHILSLTNK